MLEIELKFPVTDFVTIESALLQWQAEKEKVFTYADRYFNAPDRDFAQTDEALRLRSIESRNFVTYKGPKSDNQSKTRKEIEVPIAEGAEPAMEFQELLLHLGYRFVAEVRKQRAVYHLQKSGFALEICLDDVRGLGRFIELEIVAPENQLDAARTVLEETAQALQLQSSERRSYLEMLLQKQGQTP